MVYVRYSSTDIYQVMKMNQLDLKIFININKWKRLEKSLTLLFKTYQKKKIHIFQLLEASVHGKHVNHVILDMSRTCQSTPYSSDGPSSK